MKSSILNHHAEDVNLTSFLAVISAFRFLLMTWFQIVSLHLLVICLHIS